MNHIIHHPFAAATAAGLNTSIAFLSPYILTVSAAAMAVFLGSQWYTYHQEGMDLRNWGSDPKNDDRVRLRVQQAYHYIFGGFAITAAAAAIAHISNLSTLIFTMGYVSAIGFLAISIGSIYTIHINPADEEQKLGKLPGLF